MESRCVSKSYRFILFWAEQKGKHFPQQALAVPLAWQDKRCRSQLHPRHTTQGVLHSKTLIPEGFPKSGPGGGRFLVLPLERPADFSGILSHLVFQHSHFLLSLLTKPLSYLSMFDIKIKKGINLCSDLSALFLLEGDAASFVSNFKARYYAVFKHMAFIQLIIVHYLLSSMVRNLIPGLLIPQKTQIRKSEE